jgi:hypothetical protein
MGVSAESKFSSVDGTGLEFYAAHRLGFRGDRRRSCVDVRVMMRPQRFLCMCGIPSRAKYTLLRKFSSRARCHSSSGRGKKPFGRRASGVGDADIASEFSERQQR